MDKENYGFEIEYGKEVISYVNNDCKPCSGVYKEKGLVRLVKKELGFGPDQEQDACCI